ncbi:M23 family metallopeptidase [Deinococcus sp. QL22]|uniref:LysM peptidoglycan-binding domain-containing M23 family metallopeptidase n=1 Tax=Deinococcus sp. QL22 TaxID=2939437 RepID=UPI002017908D|nr:M23 family metallopeptidase [Deinococcus sp. QL22]UQN09482.1 LysM peptidoglycan-binding domain-containing M23 family metallopeptidase [Deinococcus sp. QL22]
MIQTPRPPTSPSMQTSAAHRTQGRRPFLQFRQATLLVLALLSSGASAYTVKPGDTLYSLARAQGTTVAELMRLNRLTSTALEVGQALQFPGEVPVQTPATPQTEQLVGLTVVAPATLEVGEAFVLRLGGPRAAQATVRFLSEEGEDVQLPGEALQPVAFGNEFVVLGRVVLGKSTPLVYDIQVGEERLRGTVKISSLPQPIQRLNLPASLSSKLEASARKAEDTVVEQTYLRRTPQAWSKPFQPALKVQGQSTAFGQPRIYVTGGPVQYHYGIDYPAPAGTPVTAMNDGTVVLAELFPVRGGLVVIDHGAGVSSLYFHQRKLLVRIGERVQRGQKIGEVGSTGLSTGPHLHLELRVRGTATDPAGWMNRLWPQ